MSKLWFSLFVHWLKYPSTQLGSVGVHQINWFESHWLCAQAIPTTVSRLQSLKLIPLGSDRCSVTEAIKFRSSEFLRDHLVQLLYFMGEQTEAPKEGNLYHPRSNAKLRTEPSLSIKSLCIVSGEHPPDWTIFLMLISPQSRGKPMSSFIPRKVRNSAYSSTIFGTVALLRTKQSCWCFVHLYRRKLDLLKQIFLKITNVTAFVKESIWQKIHSFDGKTGLDRRWGKGMNQHWLSLNWEVGGFTSCRKKGHINCYQM